MAQRSNIQHVSVNALAKPLLKKLIKNAKALGIEISRLDNGCTIVDAGIKAQGSVEAGLLIAEICMGGLGKAKVKNNSQFKHCAELISKTIEVLSLIHIFHAVFAPLNIHWATVMRFNGHGIAG